ncbi:MAG TPA: hypothetical protein VIK91_24790 [Nannocystis sp.]
MAGPKHSELPAVVVPQHLWLRSARPTQGKVVQWALPGVLIVAGLLASATTVRVSLVLAGLSAFLLLPSLVIGQLEKIGREVAAADNRRAEWLLRDLPERPIVRLFAPVAWRSLQAALLHLKLGDGRQAAQEFAETARLCGQPDAVMLVSAQAHALVLAGERARARELLQKLAQANLLGPRDHLDLGIVLLIESKKFKQALSYIEVARKTIGDHPRVLAAQALALQKNEHIDEAQVLLEQVQIALKDAPHDPIAEDLVKRTRKAMQDYLEAQLRRERRARSRRTTIVVSSEAAASEIVSGEISGNTEPTPSEMAQAAEARAEAEPMKRFSHAEPTPSPAFLPSREADAPKPREADAPRPREADAPQPGLEIDLYSAPHTSAPSLSELLKDRPQAPKSSEAPAAESSGTAEGAPAATATPPKSEAPQSVLEAVASLTVGAPKTEAPAEVPAEAPKTEEPAEVKTEAPVAEVPAEAPKTATPVAPDVEGPKVAPKIEAPVLPPITPGRTGTLSSLIPPRPAAAAESTGADKPAESDAPVMRRRQTLIGTLPGGEPSKPPAPSLPSLASVAPPTGGPLPTGLPRTGLPTRSPTRLDLPAIGANPTPNAAPPVFKPPPKPDDKKS